MGDDRSITRRRAVAGGVGVAALGGGVAYLATRSGSDSGGYVPETSHTSRETTGFGVELAGRPIAGDPEAPVDIYYWTDYLCPFCAEFERETLPALGRNHVDAGEVRLVALPYPNIGEYSMPAAVWSRCVWSQVADDEPAAFWRWHAAAFEAQAESGTDWADEATFTRITERTEGVPRSDVDSCRTARGGEIRESIEPNVAIAQSSRIRGTPGFVLYNREADAAGKLVGAHPYENFAEAIDRVLDA
jgi:protein-disulfide isomerase